MKKYQSIFVPPSKIKFFRLSRKSRVKIKKNKAEKTKIRGRPKGERGTHK